MELSFFMIINTLLPWIIAILMPLAFVISGRANLANKRLFLAVAILASLGVALISVIIVSVTMSILRSDAENLFGGDATSWIYLGVMVAFNVTATRAVLRMLRTLTDGGARRVPGLQA